MAKYVRSLNGEHGGVLRVVAGLEQEQPVVVAGAVGGGDAAAADREEQQPQPAGARRRARSAACRSAGRPGRRRWPCPPRASSPTLSSRQASSRAASMACAVVEHFERRLADLRQARQPVAEVRPELRRQAVEIRVPGAGQRQVRRIAAPPDAGGAAVGRRELAERPRASASPLGSWLSCSTSQRVAIVAQRAPDRPIRLVRRAPATMKSVRGV